MPTNAAPELILSLGLEGGGLDIHRLPGRAGGWSFQISQSDMALDDNDEECWKHRSSPLFETFPEALASITAYQSWVYFCPISVSPEYRAATWEHLQSCAARLPAERQPQWMRIQHAWQRACLGPF